MESKIVVGYDGRPESRDALALARQLAAATGDRIEVVTVVAARESSAWDAVDDLVGAPSIPPGIARTGAVADLPLESRTCEDADPPRTLRELAEAEGAALVVLGSAHRGGLGRTFLGSTAEGVLRCAPCPVAVAPRGFARRTDQTMRRIGVAFDGSPESHQALQRAAVLAEGARATLCAVTVIESVSPPALGSRPPAVTVTRGRGEDLDAWRRKAAKARLTQASASLPTDLDVLPCVRSGSPVGQLLAETDDLDLILIGSRGYGLLRRIHLGYVSGALLCRSACPVVVVPQPPGTGELTSGTARRPQLQSALHQ
jgi:nucleotide-binding universal stress UspA family protein